MFRSTPLFRNLGSIPLPVKHPRSVAKLHLSLGSKYLRPSRALYSSARLMNMTELASSFIQGVLPTRAYPRGRQIGLRCPLSRSEPLSHLVQPRMTEAYLPDFRQRLQYSTYMQWDVCRGVHIPVHGPWKHFQRVRVGWITLSKTFVPNWKDKRKIKKEGPEWNERKIFSKKMTTEHDYRSRDQFCWAVHGRKGKITQLSEKTEKRYIYPKVKLENDRSQMLYNGKVVVETWLDIGLRHGPIIIMMRIRRMV